jgi:CubicO group peptidase (beta-lactamase class C family)
MRHAQVFIPLVALLAAVACSKRHTELVAGTDEPPPPRVTPDYAGIDIAALDAAAAWAGERDSRALIVWRRGHIVYEKYWGGADFDTVLDLGELNAALAALLLGLAQEDGRIDAQPLLQQKPDPQLLVQELERATGQPYAQYLSERLWKRIGAGDARVAPECCLLARQGDWIRLGALLASDGLYDASQVVPSGWISQLLAARYPFELGEPYDPQRAGEPYATRDVFFLGRLSKNRLWLVPSLGLAVLRTGEGGAGDADWDDAMIPNLVIRGTRDFRPPSGTPVDLKSLVPNH